MQRQATQAQQAAHHRASAVHTELPERRTKPAAVTIAAHATLGWDSAARFVGSNGENFDLRAHVSKLCC